MGSPTISSDLQKFHDMLKERGHDSHHDGHEYSEAVRMFIRLFQSGERPHTDDVKHWAMNNGWDEEDARDLGEMCHVVGETMRILKHI